MSRSLLNVAIGCRKRLCRARNKIFLLTLKQGFIQTSSLSKETPFVSEISLKISFYIYMYIYIYIHAHTQYFIYI